MMLSMSDVSAGYDELRVLHDVSLRVDEGEIVALIGPNGAGKSTVLKSICSLVDMSSGRIVFRDRDITRLATHDLLRIGVSYVPQGRINFTTMTIEENLLLGGADIRDKALLRERLESVYLQFPVLRDRRKELAYGLSGGEQQMLALGRALMHNPKLLLLDEPSLGLSPKLVQELFSTLVRLRDDGISILVVEQNAKKAIEVADRTYLLEQGRVVLSGGKGLLRDKKIKRVYLGGGAASK